MNLAEQFSERLVTSLDLSRYVLVDAGTPVRTVVTELNRTGHTCAVVSRRDGDAGPIGIVTDRDILTRVVGYPTTWDMPVETVMTPEPESIPADGSVTDALEMMNVFRFRNVPVVARDGALVGNLDRYALLHFAAELLFSDASTETHEPAAQHALLFVDFTGLALAEPVTVGPETDVKRVVHTMRGRGIGSVLVANEHGENPGIFTDHDAQMNVACKIDNLASVEIAGVMTEDPITLDERRPIADALRLMAEQHISHIPLTRNAAHAVAVISFRDVADYLGSTFISMA